MNHSDKSNPEDTSEKLEESSEKTEKEDFEEEDVIKDKDNVSFVDGPKEEGHMKEKEEVPEEEEEPEEWICDICETVYSNDNTYEISGYHEKICGQCYDRGLMWCIREAWKWRAQVRIDVLRKPRDE